MCNSTESGRVCLSHLDLQQPDTPEAKINSSGHSPSEEQVAEAERLKTDGKSTAVGSHG